MKGRLALGLGACSVLVACGRSAELPDDQLWSSAHFDYRTRAAEADTCPDVLGPLERHFATLQGYLGFAWPAEKKVTYWKFVDGADLDAHGDCGVGAACAPGSDVESPAPLDTHELVHAYLYPTGYPPPVLVEGAAVALSCGAAIYGLVKPTVGWETLASFTEGPNDVYAPGAWLVGYLLDAYGPGPFLSLYAALPHGADAAAMDAAVKLGYGKSLADIWAAALAEDQPRNNCIWQCAGDPITLDGRPFDTAGTCGVPVDRPFVLATEATIAFETSAAGLTLGPCGPTTPPGDFLFGTPSAVTIYHLPAGRYFLDHQPLSGNIVGIADASATLNADCTAATDGAFLGKDNIFVAVPRSDHPWFLALPPATNRKLAVAKDAGGEAALCSSCAADAACTVTGPGSVDWNGAEVLRLTPDPMKPWSGYLPFLE